MKIFEVNRDEDNWTQRYEIRARHKWTLPGVKCSVCGCTWGANGLNYPSVLLPPGLDEKLYQSHWPVKLEKLKELIMPLRNVIDQSLDLKPGTEFGPLCGTASGKHGDFTWAQVRTLLISPSALTRLIDSGITTLRTVSTNILSRGKVPFSHLEVDLEPRASLSLDGFPPSCDGCGRVFVDGTEFEKWNSYKILRSSIPGNHDLFRMREFSSYIFATERFVLAVERLRLTNIRFVEVEII